MEGQRLAYVLRSSAPTATVPVVCAACHKAMALPVEALLSGGKESCEFCGAVTDLGPVAARLPTHLDAQHLLGAPRHLSEFP